MPRTARASVGNICCHVVNRDSHPFLSDGPVERPDNCLSIVHQRQPEAGPDVIHNCVNRGWPFGDNLWAGRTGERLGLQSTLNPRGRPPKRGKK